MQFATSLLSLFALASSVRAAPSQAVEERQNGARIYAKFFSDNACLGTWVEDTVWLQEAAGGCIDVNIPFAYNSTLIADNLATRALRAYSVDGCNENAGNWFDVPAGIEQCYKQHIESVKFL
ncbi:hypothetical protein JX265_006875 [Neoarthrinium moseri]|uniref:Uncharacterized protein n=1 Tax=Neoarthrinium moseri TaxID=1658444 RepID=A0A9P9WLE5_9PEZI|nr:hypothetical protein JX266_011533 [Neoarthrinium moseri]KAI1868896.1 hypothetical protein JX265_006875 [Neoarthrinium moseri]